MDKALVKFHAIPRVQLTHGPTPIDTASRLSEELGCEIYIKRDDCTGLAGGGNKVRKLEYLLADAQKHQANTLITIGGIQSNHARQTAAVAAKFGFECELILEDVIGTPKADYYHNGNILLNNLFAATIHPMKFNQDSGFFAQNLINGLSKKGKKPYFIPIGGSNVTGSFGYMHCAQELLEQTTQQNLEIDQIVLATGSAGTQAGLLAGLIIAQVDIPVLGICVSRSTQEQEFLVKALLMEILPEIGLDPQLATNKVICNGNYVGDGYGIPTDGMIKAVNHCAQLEGILLDPVYTGKAMAGFIDLCKKGIIAKNSKQLFLHTGGSQSLFAYREVFD